MSPRDLVTVTPSIVMVNQSESAQFMCTSSGGPGNTFQWYHNGQILSGENSTILNITMVTASNAGEYNCTVSNEAGSDGDVSTLIGEGNGRVGGCECASGDVVSLLVGEGCGSVGV